MAGFGAGALLATSRALPASDDFAPGLPTGPLYASAIERPGDDPAQPPVCSFRLPVCVHAGRDVAPDVALAGFGALSIERWGRALVFVVDRTTGGTDGDRLLAPLLASAISNATKVEARCVRLARDGDRARFLITGPKGAEKVRDWLLSGISWGEALVRLHPGAHAGDA